MEMQNRGWKAGKWKAYCDICGSEFYNDQLKEDFRGLMVCNKDFELRNPQDFVRTKPERITPPWTRPRDGAEFATIVTVNTISNSDPNTVTLTTLDIFIDTSAGAINWYLPPAGAGSLFGEVVYYTINNYAGSNNVTVLPSAVSSNNLIGSATILPGITAKFTNLNSKTWKRIL